MKYVIHILVCGTIMGCLGNSAVALTTVAPASLVRSLSGPTQRTTYQQGTWQLEVSTVPYNARYTVSWGDEYLGTSLTSGALTRTTTALSHAYDYPGTYTVTARVTSANGATSQKSTTVRVTEPNMTPNTQGYTNTYVPVPYYVPQYSTQTVYVPTNTTPAYNYTTRPVYDSYDSYGMYESDYYSSRLWNDGYGYRNNYLDHDTDYERYDVYGNAWGTPTYEIWTDY